MISSGHARCIRFNVHTAEPRQCKSKKTSICIVRQPNGTLSWQHDTFDHQRNQMVWSYQYLARHPPGLARQMPRSPKPMVRHETCSACKTVLMILTVDLDLVLQTLSFQRCVVSAMRGTNWHGRECLRVEIRKSSARKTTGTGCHCAHFDDCTVWNQQQRSNFLPPI